MTPRRLPQGDEVEVRLVTAAAMVLKAPGGLSPPLAVGAAAAAAAVAMTAAIMMAVVVMVMDPR